MASATKYIISSHGFFVNLEFVSEIPHLGKQKCIWSKTLREAKACTLNQAKGYIDIINKIYESDDCCFIWSPFDTTYHKGLYEVVRRQSYYSLMDEKEHNILEWYVSKVTVSENDLSVLNDLKSDKSSKKYYSFDEATEIAKQKNLLLLEELIKIIK